MFDSTPSERWRYRLSSLGVALVTVSLLYIPFSYGPPVADLPEVAVPVGVSMTLLGFGAHLGRANYDPERVRRIAEWSWRGTLAAGLVGAWWVVLHLSRGTPIFGLTDQLLTLVSFGVGAGAVVGTVDARQRCARRPPDRSDVAAETTWVRRGGVDAVTLAIVEAMADAEGVEPTDVDVTLYDHVDPDALELLATHEGSPWQLSFHTDRYEVRVSSYGTVTVFERVEA